MSASLSTGQATSSISMDVPASRAAPTMGMRPLRTSQKVLQTWRGWAWVGLGWVGLGGYWLVGCGMRGWGWGG
jgi:hypothetical protein